MIWRKKGAKADKNENKTDQMKEVVGFERHTGR
jgi:hypothetical protein